MQYRMKTHQLNQSQIKVLLNRIHTGCLATISPNNTPYVVPVHFVYCDNKIYIHGLPAGEKISNIKNNAHVCFTAYEMDCFLLDEKQRPCDTNTKYQSVVVKGTAALLDHLETKDKILKKIIEKYTPHLKDTELPVNMVHGTAVIELNIAQITGKFYDEA